MHSSPRHPKTVQPAPARKVFPWFDWLFGAFLGLTLLKFGNPVLLDRFFDWPANGFEWVLNAWPVAIGRGLLVVVTLAGLAVLKPAGKISKLLLLLPAAWLGWQVLALPGSVSPPISSETVIHFVCTVVCFYLGVFALGRRIESPMFFVFILLGFLVMLFYGLEQHFGGLKTSRDYWLIYVYPTLKEVPPALVKRMTSERIFGTLFYPNSLAGAILLILPMVLGLCWSAQERFTQGARILLMTLFGLSAVGCLFWSGSKAGWLIFLLQGVVFVLTRPISKQIKIGIIVAVITLGLAGFAIKNLVFFKKGATSVVARFDYWEAAVATTKDKPLFGNGPGTFGKAYELRKRPESEMAQLAHNDYLQQASDSGVMGFAFFTTFIIWGMVRSRQAVNPGTPGAWIRLGVWLGLLGWAVQSFVEFGLYIPAISWLAFALMGWLLAQGNGVDNVRRAG